MSRPRHHAGNGHSLDQGEGITLHGHPVRESAGIPFVGIAHHVLLVGRGLQHGLPLDGRRECRAAATTQAGLRELFHRFCGREAQHILQTLPATQTTIVVQGQGIGDAHPRKAQSLLPGKIGMLFHFVDGPFVFASAQEAGVKQRRHIGRGHRGVAHSPACGFHFHQRFKPHHAARAIADDGHALAALGGFIRHGTGHFIGPHAEGTGIAGNEHARGHHFFSTCASQASTCSRRRRPLICPSSTAAGAQAQLPRQYTGFKVTAPSAVVS